MTGLETSIQTDSKWQVLENRQGGFGGNCGGLGGGTSGKWRW